LLANVPASGAAAMFDDRVEHVLDLARFDLDLDLSAAVVDLFVAALPAARLSCVGLFASRGRSPAPRPRPSPPPRT
jgi:hypothetical protein